MVVAVRLIVFVENIVFELVVMWVQMKMVERRRNHTVEAHLQMICVVVDG